jgi:hypothetical protein
MAEHINITLLEFLVLDASSLNTAERERIQLHLESCSLCRELMISVETMYQQVREEAARPPTDRDRHKADQILPRGLTLKSPEERVVEAYGLSVEPVRRSIGRRIARFAGLHPYRSGMALTAFAAVVVTLFSLSSHPKDRNPTYAEIKNYVLSVYNKEADVIWKKGVPGMPDWTSNTPPLAEQGQHRLLSITDLDGDGTNELLVLGSAESAEFAVDSIYCFEGSGGLRWRAGAGDMPSFGKAGTARHTRPVIYDVQVFRARPGERLQIFALAVEQVYSPSKLFELSAADGTILSSFNNKGGCDLFLHADIDRDGRQELMLGGLNDGFNKACLAILDPARVSGCSPLPEGMEWQGGSGGSELYYLLFPRWGPLEMLPQRLYGSVGRIIVNQDGSIDVGVKEALPEPPKAESVNCYLYFGLSPDLAVHRLLLDDSARSIGENLYRQGTIKSPLTSELFESLKDSVVYWDGVRFVNRPTKNSELVVSAAP